MGVQPMRTWIVVTNENKDEVRAAEYEMEGGYAHFYDDSGVRVASFLSPSIIVLKPEPGEE